MLWNCRNGNNQHEGRNRQTFEKGQSYKGINVDIDEDNEVILSFHVIVAYGVSIFTVSDNLISSVKYEVEKFSGLKVKKIQIYVEGVRIID